MSHFTKINTKLTRQDWLLKILKKNAIPATTNKKNKYSNIVIEQENSVNSYFEWNGNSYDLIADLQFWQQELSFDAFLQKIQKDYNQLNLLVQTEKLGFMSTQTKEHLNGSTTVVLQRFLTN